MRAPEAVVGHIQPDQTAERRFPCELRLDIADSSGVKLALSVGGVQGDRAAPVGTDSGVEGVERVISGIEKDACDGICIKLREL